MPATMKLLLEPNACNKHKNSPPSPGRAPLSTSLAPAPQKLPTHNINETREKELPPSVAGRTCNTSLVVGTPFPQHHHTSVVCSPGLGTRDSGLGTRDRKLEVPFPSAASPTSVALWTAPPCIAPSHCILDLAPHPTKLKGVRKEKLTSRPLLISRACCLVPFSASATS